MLATPQLWFVRARPSSPCNMLQNIATKTREALKGVDISTASSAIPVADPVLFANADDPSTLPDLTFSGSLPVFCGLVCGSTFFHIADFGDEINTTESVVYVPVGVLPDGMQTIAIRTDKDSNRREGRP